MEVDEHSVPDTDNMKSLLPKTGPSKKKWGGSETRELKAEQHLRMKANLRESRTDLDATDDELDTFFNAREVMVGPSKGVPKQESSRNKLPKKEPLRNKPTKKKGMSRGPEITEEKLAKKLPEKQRVPDTEDSILNLVAGEHLLLDPDAKGHLQDRPGNGDASHMALEKSEGTSGKSNGAMGNEGSIFPQSLLNLLLEFLGSLSPKQNLDEALRKESLDRNLDSDNNFGSDPYPLPTAKDRNTSVVEPDSPSELPNPTNTAEEPVAKDQECSVCAESFPVQDFPSLIACSHEPSVCHECFLAWLEQRIASTTWEQIVCPSGGCSTIVSHDDVKIYASADVFTRYVHCSHDPIARH
jgi:hypothetical protein